MLDWRLRAYRHWLTMVEPTWAMVHYPKIDYQQSVYYSAPSRARRAWMKSIRNCSRPTRSWAFRWPNVQALAGVAVDAVFDSVSVTTTF